MIADGVRHSRAAVAGHTRVCPAPCFSHLSTLHNLRALTVVDCPFATDAAAGAAMPPVAATLGALGSLTKLRIGHSGRVSALRGVSPHDAGEARAVHAMYAAIGQLDLLDLTLDCHPLFDVKDLQAVVSGAPRRAFVLLCPASMLCTACL